MAVNQVVLYFDKPQDALLFHSGCQCGNVARRAAAQQQGSR